MRTLLPTRAACSGRRATVTRSAADPPPPPARRLTPLPAEFGEAKRKERAERAPYTPQPLPADFGANYGAGDAAAPSFGAAVAPPSRPTTAPPPLPKAGSSPFGATKPGGAPASPFGSPKPAASPFGASSAAAVKSPFGAPPAASAPKLGAAPPSPFGGAAAPRAAPPLPAPLPPGEYWALPKLTLAQTIIAVSFTSITALMLSTFYVVLSTGGIHFNDS